MSRPRKSRVTGTHYRRTGGASRKKIGGGEEALPRTRTDRIWNSIPKRDSTPKKVRRQQEAVAVEILAKYVRLESFRLAVDKYGLPIEPAGKIVKAERTQAYTLRKQVERGPNGRQHELDLVTDTLTALRDHRLPPVDDPFLPAVAHSLYLLFFELYERGMDQVLPADMQELRARLDRHRKKMTIHVLANHCRYR